MKKIILALFVISAFLLGGISAYGLVDAGNKVCPVSGDKVNADTKATVEYNGTTYNLCCPMCVEPFRKDPEKYVKIVEKELAADKK